VVTLASRISRFILPEVMCWFRLGSLTILVSLSACIYAATGGKSTSGNRSPSSATDEVRRLAPFELNCPVESLEFVILSTRPEVGVTFYQVGTRGCGRQASYAVSCGTACYAELKSRSSL
jgi:hypothetical protein